MQDSDTVGKTKKKRRKKRANLKKKHDLPNKIGAQKLLKKKNKKNNR